MSGILEKRPEGANRRQSRVDKELKEKRKTRIITVSVTAAIVVLFVGALFINSGFIRRILPALTYGDVKFSAAEYDYYFVNALSEYQQYQEYYASMLGDESSKHLPSNESALSSQIFDEETGQTWAEYLSQMALNNMSNIAKLYSIAMANNFKLPDEKIKEIDDQIMTLKSQVAGSYPTLDNYLHLSYGKGMNESCLRKIMINSTTASAYSESVRDSFTYNADQLAEYNEENADDLDNFNYRLFHVNADLVDDDHEHEEGEEHDHEAANAAALAESREHAKQMVSVIKSEDDFIKAAKDYDEASYGDPDSTLVENLGSSLTQGYGEWLKDKARVNGDVTSMDSEGGAYVVLFVKRDKNEYNTAEMRQIYISIGSVDSAEYEGGEEDPGYIQAVADAETAAEEKAKNVETLFDNGGKTEDKFLELLEEYSDGSKDDGGFYDRIKKGNMGIAEMDDWLFAPERKAGDSTLIKSSYGYHFLFFKGYGKRACDVTAEDAMRERDYNAWTENLTTVEPETRWAFILTQKH